MLRRFYQKKRDAFLARHIPMQSSKRLTRNNIYIVPTKAGFGLLFTVALILFAAINYQNNSLFLFAFSILAVFLLSILSTFENLVALELSSGAASLVQQGLPLRHNLLLKKHNGKQTQALTLFIAEQEIDIDVVDASVLAMSVDTPSTPRGIHRLDRFKLETRFPFGLVRAWSYMQPNAACFVYPKPEPSDLEAFGGFQEESQQRRLESDDFVNIRHWQQGESPKRILWRAFARTGELLSLQYDYQSASPAFLDWDAIEGDEEHKLRIMSYWVLHYSRAGQPFAMKLPHLLLPYDTGENAKNTALRALASFGYDDVNV